MQPAHPRAFVIVQFQHVAEVVWDLAIHRRLRHAIANRPRAEYTKSKHESNDE
jgi:hypothetical protein